MDEEQADAVEKAFDLDYDVAQAFSSHITPKVVLLFTGEAPNDGIDFEPEDEEVDNGNDDNKGRDNEARGGTGFTFPEMANMTGE